MSACNYRFVLLLVALTTAAIHGPQPVRAQQLSCAEMEVFLNTAKVVAQRGVPKGITLPSRLTLDDGKIKHDALFQTIDEAKASFQGQRGAELNFRDTWKFNVASYELAKILELNMVPPYVERKHAGKTGSFAWWVNDAMMEVDRVQKKIEPPDPDAWNLQMYVVRVFHQLVHDNDPNLTNLLITKDWQIWIIDQSRAFRWMKNLPTPKNLVKCDRKLLAKLRGLSVSLLQAKLSRWLTKPEIEGIAARAGKIVEIFDKEVAAKGEAAILYDLPRSGQACGTGL